jgi:peptidoglycan/LPS O-acetylase OafA/YrhL
LIKICVGILICSPLVRLAFYALGSSEWFVYANTLTRLDAIASGAALAVWIRDTRFERESMQRIGLMTAGVAGIAAVVTLRFAESSAIVKNASYSFVALACAGVVAMTLGWQGEDLLLPQLFRQRCLRFLGRISFALYLFNYPVYVLVHGNRGMALTSRLRLSSSAAEILLFLLGNAVLVATAWLSWQLLEKPMLQLKSRLAAR